MAEQQPATERTASHRRGRRPLVLALIRDLMLETRLEAAAQAVGAELRVCPALEEAARLLHAEQPVAVIVDLTDASFPADETVRALHSGPPPAPLLLGFFPHVMKEIGLRAEQSGYDMVVPRSRFMTDTPGMLRTLIEGRMPERAAGVERGQAD